MGNWNGELPFRNSPSNLGILKKANTQENSFDNLSSSFDRVEELKSMERTIQKSSSIVDPPPYKIERTKFGIEIMELQD